jgi:hypothetical protein
MGWEVKSLGLEEWQPPGCNSPPSCLIMNPLPQGQRAVGPYTVVLGPSGPSGFAASPGNNHASPVGDEPAGVNVSCYKVRGRSSNLRCASYSVLSNVLPSLYKRAKQLTKGTLVSTLFSPSPPFEPNLFPVSLARPEHSTG